MKTSARLSFKLSFKPHAPARPHHGAAEWIYRACLRIWLRYRLDTCTRCLHTIAAQRANDFHAERLLHQDISAMRSRLQSL
ncbi:hypothetical protein [Massilia phyllosphaerae]|uniref:hypothetical protein n=1 Tax=Massilia phyllosphaerae TaxID=3106034 RepID=UPI002B1CAA8A|nr:hypothetical protein [Massilia sp. SGZ-792]